MAYTKYSLTPANNTAAPPDGAPEGMLPSAVNDTMRDMMAQIRDVGDGIRGGTYTMTAPIITGGTINGATIGATTASTGKFTAVTNSALTSGRVTYAGTAGVLQDDADFTFNGTTVTMANDASISGLTVGKGGGAVSNNTVVGLNAGVANTTGKITAVGYLAARFNTTGSGNTAIGGNDATQDGALYLNTTGSYNIAMGTGAVASNTTGSSNTGIGYSALQNNTTASNNVAVGYQALYSQTTPSAANSGLGYQAGYSITTGIQNTCMGTESGRGVTTGAGNTFLGHGSGYYMTTGSKNTIVGKYDGNQGGLDIRTSSNYIVLSDGDGNPRQIIDGSGRVMINTTTAGVSVASARLTVNGDYSGSWGMDVNSSSASGTQFLISFGRGNSQCGSISSTATNSTSYTTSSDYRLKENITPMTGALAKVTALKPVTYSWKSDGTLSEGFIAHELAEIVPDCVVGEKDAVDAEGNPVYQGIDTSFLVATLTASIQELHEMVKAQALEIAQLKGN